MQPRQAPPEHPFPEYPQQHPILRFLTSVRDHGFALAVVASLLIVVAVFHQFRQWDQADPGALMIPLRGGSAASASGIARDSAAVLTVDTYPDGAAMYLNGTSLGLTPVKRISLPPGTYRVSIQKPAYQVVDSTVTLLSGESAMLIIPLDAASGDERTLAMATDAPPGPTPRETVDRAPRRTNPPVQPPVNASRPAAASIPDPTTGRLELRSEPEGAAVWMDNRLVGHTPLSLDAVAPGEHVVSFRKNGYESPATVIDVRPGHTATVSPRLTPLLGTLKVLAKPWGSIYVDGELKQEASDVRFSTPLPPGRYRVTVVHPVLGQWETVTEVPAGEEASYVVDFNRISTSGRATQNSPVRGW